MKQHEFLLKAVVVVTMGLAAMITSPAEARTETASECSPATHCGWCIGACNCPIDQCIYEPCYSFGSWYPFKVVCEEEI